MLLKTSTPTYDSDYAYIDLFIGFLQKIINIIKDLFSGIGGSEDAE